MSSPPSGGSCLTIPRTGMAADTLYHIICTGWKGGGSSLQYSLSLLRNTSKAGDSDSVVLAYGSFATMSVTLPEGAKNNSYLQRLAIIISDSYRASSQVIVTVQVIVA